MVNSVFGFSTEPSVGGDFTPIIKYDARAGRIFRIDRLDTGNGFESNPVDITATFKAVIDFENVEVGWIDFATGTAPSFVLVPMGQEMPVRPSPKHKNGIRMLVKLNKACGGDKPVREIAGTAKTFLNGVEKVYQEYQREAAKYPGQLPVISLASTTPVTSGNGTQKSTNYAPTFRIEGWAKRPEDLKFVSVATNGSGVQTQGAPQTGHQTVPPPNKLVPQVNTIADDDFG
jgi:hypothetical protein